MYSTLEKTIILNDEHPMLIFLKYNSARIKLPEGTTWKREGDKITIYNAEK